MTPIQTTKRALRRFLLEKQLLLDSQPSSMNVNATMPQRVLDVIRQLECIQIDPVAAVRPNQHLALSARIPGYEPDALNVLLSSNEVFEYMANAACIIPMSDYPFFEPTRQRLRENIQPHLDQIAPVVEQVLQRLEMEGPLSAKSFDSSERVHGYWDNVNVNAKTKATSHALNLLTDAAQIRIVGREGNQRRFHLTSQTVPARLIQQAENIDEQVALEAMLLKYFRAYRVFDASDPRLGWQRLRASERRETIDSHIREGIVSPVDVTGLDKPYYILAEDMERLLAHIDEERELPHYEEDADATVHFLPPLDNLLWSRKRLTDLFEFDYRWEIYTPAVKRTYGYYAMPILAGDRFIGRMDPRLDKKQGQLTVEYLQIDPDIDFTKKLKDQVYSSLEAFAKAHGATTVSVARRSFE
ncbi:winged helix-turn-helix domain-containing protein [Paenibacillus lignilyticus]|uniref:YcaQ family DNA glycosylase n=1 Tax=Paenibacillus lignilyticus TaxID=1172615 RepID=A0ABS5CE72_9BACL|nr:crosslink repair DNA glycosylase YcaQ family protein [Paenibacillus lignilyticus]MBP3964047.1 YcaQ family DNA glycosylase [Paenibacillus lignilyticus]